MALFMWETMHKNHDCYCRVVGFSSAGFRLKRKDSVVNTRRTMSDEPDEGKGPPAEGSPQNFGRKRR